MSVGAGAPGDPGSASSPASGASPASPPSRTTRRQALRLLVVRILVVLTSGLGLWYVSWRWTSSINWSDWWIAVPLVLAETYALLDGLLFGITMWRSRQRPAPPPPPDGATVDVLITTYNEPVDLVIETARAARAIRYPHRTFVLDDGARPDMRAAAEAIGVGYLTRSTDWEGRPRHAKAGNLNNALFATDGEYLLILDADQIPDPAILERTLGYFTDPRMALVQTPQWFTNVPDYDPLGSQAPLFYGPIQQGKDGWNAAFFCGSNAILRREALMQLGVVGYVRSLERSVRTTLDASRRVLTRARRQAAGNPVVLSALDEVRAALATAQHALDTREPLAEVTHDFQRAVEAASARVVRSDLAAMQADLAEIGVVAPPVEVDTELRTPVVDDAGLERLASRDMSPLAALGSISALLQAVDVDRADEAQPLMPLATISVTEDMATAMRLHGAGWRSAYHHEVLAKGLAPEDLPTMMQQRLRWAQGTLQVMLRENPLVQKGLSLGQRLMYFATMWSYLSGFAALAFVLAPVLYLVAGVRPVHSFGGPFLLHLLPYLAANQLLFAVVGYGVRTWRGQQYSLAMFPLWIRACTTVIGNVFFGRKLGFVVTPKTSDGPDRRAAYRVIAPQLVAMAVLVLSAVVGIIRLVLGVAPSAEGTILNVVWVGYDLLSFSVLIVAANYGGYREEAYGGAHEVAA